MADLLPLRVLVIDDERNIRQTLAICLEGFGCKAEQVATGAAALDALRREPFDLAFCDLKLAGESGLDLLPRLLGERPGLDVVIITAYATVDTAVEAMRRGAKDYLPKPFTPAQIQRIVEAARERREPPPEAVSPAMRSVMEIATKAAAHDVPVLLAGESGTGKTMLARTIHMASPRRERPFFVVNCPSLSEELLGSELFGHAKGAFTGAVRDQPGRVEAAEGGTLFLDEIGDLPDSLQAKLLRFLQDKQFERLGETRTRTADVRIVAATNRDLSHLREDLRFRLNVVQITVPPLRERREEILPLARRFLAGRATLTPEAERALEAHGWPGNVRELRNAIERAVILTPGQTLTPEAIFPERRAGAPALGGDFTVEEIEREHILRVLARTRTQEEAARILGLDVSTLWRKRRTYEDG